MGKAFKAGGWSRRRLIIIGCGLIALIVGGLSWKHLQGKNQGPAKAFKVQRKNIAQSLQLSGKIMPEKTMVITAQQSGRILALNVKEGAKVEPDQLLFTMQLEAAGQTELMDLRARVRSLEQEVNSSSKLVRNKSSVAESSQLGSLDRCGLCAFADPRHRHAGG